MKEICRECKKSVKAGDARFVNRIHTDTNEYICAECDSKIRKEI